VKKKLTILHLEDQATDAELIHEAVREEWVDAEFHVVADAGTFKQALEQLVPDIVLSDYRVPGFSGHEALELVRAKETFIPFIYVSGSMGEEKAIETLRDGATDYVLKDRLNRLVPAVERAVDEAERRRAADAAARALRESEQRLELALQGADLGLWDWDIPSGTAIFNERWATMLGFRLAEVTPTVESWTARIHEEDKLRVMAALDAHLEGRSDFLEAEYRMATRAGGWRWVLNRGRVVQRGADGRPRRATGTHLDITDRKNSELTNAQLAAQLQQAHKMESLGTLAGGIAHDFNNILGAIIGFSELVRSDLPPGSHSRDDLGEVLKAANRAKQLVEQILTFSRQQPQDLHPLRLADAVQEASQLLRATTPSSIEVRLRLAPGTPVIRGDTTQIHQIIINLASNAIQAIPDSGGLIEICTGPLDVTKAMAAGDPELQPGPHAVLTVSDNGRGMDHIVQARIFDPFFTTKGPGAGTGLGLAVVHGVVKKHQGAIRVTSAPGQGSRFEIIFPAAPVAEPPVSESAAELVAGNGRHVMLVDDEPALVRVGRLMLERLGFQVTIFTDSAQAWEVFAAAPDRFDLVISDQTMPRLTGLELSNQMLRLRPALPVILMTGYHATASPERVRAAGVAELMMKPFTFDSLNATLRRVLASRSK